MCRAIHVYRRAPAEWWDFKSRCSLHDPHMPVSGPTIQKYVIISGWFPPTEPGGDNRPPQNVDLHIVCILLLSRAHTQRADVSVMLLRNSSWNGSIKICSPQFWAKGLLIFELNSQWSYDPTLRAAEITCWLAGFVYGSVQATMFVSHLQSQDCVCVCVWGLDSLCLGKQCSAFVAVCSQTMTEVWYLFHLRTFQFVYLWPSPIYLFMCEMLYIQYIFLNGIKLLVN